MNFERLTRYKYRIPREGKMEVDAAFYASLRQLQAGRATVDEEMSEAYKDAADVIEATHGAGIGRRVARLRPLIVVKG